MAKNTATDEQKSLVKAEEDALLKDAQEADAKGEATEEQKALLAMPDPQKLHIRGNPPG